MQMSIQTSFVTDADIMQAANLCTSCKSVRVCLQDNAVCKAQKAEIHKLLMAHSTELHEDALSRFQHYEVFLTASMAFAEKTAVDHHEHGSSLLPKSQESKCAPHPC